MKEKESRLVSLSLAFGHLRDFPLVERNGGYEWLLSFCLNSDLVRTPSQWWRVWEGKHGGGSWAPRREKVCRGVRFWRGSNREKDLSPGVTLLPPSYLLFSIHPIPSVSTLEVSLSWHEGEDELAYMPCFCLFLWLIASTLSHRLSTVIQCALCNCGCQYPSSTGQLPKTWGAEQDMPVCLTLEPRRDENCLCVLHLSVSVADSLPSCRNRFQH